MSKSNIAFRSKFASGLVGLLFAQSAVATSMPKDWQKPFNAVYEQLDENLRSPNQVNPYYHVHPGRLYLGVYLWDSAFISLIWKNRDPEIAKDVIRSVLYGQQEDGRVPQVVGPFGPNSNGLSNPAVLSYAALQIALAAPDVKFIQSVYPGLKRFHAWLWSQRRLNSGLFYWKKPYESGIDNSPRFSNRDESKIADTANVASSDASAYAVLDSESLLKLALMQLQVVSSSSPEAAQLNRDVGLFKNDQAQTKTRIQTLLWDDADGYFYDRHMDTGQFIRVASVASLIPLFAGVPTNEQWLRLREHISNPKEFYTTIPIPSVSHADPTFEKDCWRGPVWINTAYMVMKGVERYGDQPLAQSLAYRMVDGVYKTWVKTNKFVEYYDPDAFDFKNLTRKEGLGFLGLSAAKNPLTVISQLIMKRLILGSKPVGHFVGWTGLVNTIVIDDLHESPLMPPITSGED